MIASFGSARKGTINQYVQWNGLQLQLAIVIPPSLWFVLWYTSGIPEQFKGYLEKNEDHLTG